MNLLQTIAFIQAAHCNQTDKAGKPYWQHPVAVMQLLGDDTLEAKQVALLHDVLEDVEHTHLTVDDLIAAGFTSDVIEAVQLLTRDPAVPYLDYIRALAAAGNKMAIRVKLADLTHNMSRPGSLSASLKQRYQQARAILAPT